MIGHEQVIALRAEGYKPAAIFVEDKPVSRLGAEWEIDAGGLPVVYVGGDNPDRADLRFVVGLRVHLLAEDPGRAVRWVDRLLLDGAAHVVQSTNGEIFQWHQ